MITPELGRSQDVSAIPLLPEAAVTFKSTLKDLKTQVQQHLGLGAGDEERYEGCHCNCSFARQIDSNASLNELGAGDLDALHTLLVVYDNNRVARLSIDEPTKAHLQLTVRQHLVDRLSEHMSMIGGLPDPGTSSNPRYLKLPILAFCSPERHERPSVDTGLQPSSPHNTVLDLHTSEAPIHVTAHNFGLTLAAAGLEDCTIDGVLNIYAVKRVRRQMSFSAGSGSGKDAIYQQGPAWELPLGQSERGLANFLSSLRAFAGLTNARHMAAAEQDAVLHVLMLLTKFPPAVRAIHVLIRGETPDPSERAAIVQCFNEVLKTIISPPVIKSDHTRFLEGSRLLFGLILEKAKHLKVSMHDQEGKLPYIDSIKVHDLRNWITMEPVVTPLQTASGLVDRGFYEAFNEGGLLKWTNDNNTSQAKTFDRKLNRACLLSGGVKPQVLGFDIDSVNSSHRYADKGDVSKVIAAAEYSDLQYLAGLCSRNKLGVIHPSALPSADPPVLTLDRVGLLAVYVGRQACGEAGRDINMFRPTSNVVEEAVDVSIITQLLIPIIERRTADGTAVFEAFGDQNRQLKNPDEVVILCVDASASMNDRCGFMDVEESEDAVDDLEKSMANDDTDSEVEDAQFDRPALDELKEFLTSHESFDDFLAITQTGTDDYHRHKNAEKVLSILRGLAQQQIEEKAKALENAQRRETSYYYRQKAAGIERDLATLKNRSLRLQQYKDALVAFLLYRAENRVLDDPLTWSIGEDVPQIPKKSRVPSSNTPKFEIPAEFLCPISTEPMEDPVTTIDNFTYERKNIERWFQTHETSPCTNLVLDSFDLRPNYAVKQAIAAWISGDDITSKYPPTRGHFNVCFKLPLSTLTTILPSGISMDDVYQKAFRAGKGRYPSFVLHHRNALLLPSQEVAMPYIHSTDAVVVMPIEAGTASSTSGGHEDLCLVKVYRGYEHAVLSYWEPKATTKTMASVVFRLYRHAFRENPWSAVGDPFTIWTNITYTGDNHYHGHTQHHWELLSHFFNREYAIGRLLNEAVYDGKDDEGDHGSTNPTDSRGPQPLVLRLMLGSTPGKVNHKVLTRLDVLKQMFDAYVNRLLAYGFQTHVGLITFRSAASLTQNVTHAVENFRHQLNNIIASGDTALWDAIMLGRDTLLQYATKYPKAKLRIICLSDGEDTKSKQRVHDVALSLIHDRIIVDSFCLGEEQNISLKTLSYLTGGYKFEPDQMEHAMAICEMEPVLSSLERPDIVLPNLAKRFYSNPLLQFEQAKTEVRVDAVTRDTFPRRKEHPLLSQSFVELGRFTRGFSIANRSDSNLRLARIHNEIRNSGAKVHPHYDIYICESNFSFWKVVMQGRFPSFPRLALRGDLQHADTMQAHQAVLMRTVHSAST